MRKLILLVAFILLARPAKASFTFIQRGQNNSCPSGLTCTVTPGSSFGAGHALMVARRFTATGNSIASIAAGGCNVAWVILATTLLSANGSTIQMAYCTNSTAVASIQFTATNSDGGGASSWIHVFEYSFTAASVALNTGATPAGTRNQSVAAANPGGVALTLSANNAVIVQMATWGTALTAINLSYGNATFPNGDGSADLENTTSGSQPTWTGTSSTGNFAAFSLEETPAGGVAGSKLVGPTILIGPTVLH